ncbi:hypothetical protein K7432_001025 [Basidiobolus ranarum]|uniref:Uncharacterized protein n=1 Tax=Basidiobolus ranarum TaxID=34480 RepID=A0ABR2WAC6_9FUNG
MESLTKYENLRLPEKPTHFTGKPTRPISVPSDIQNFHDNQTALYNQKTVDLGSSSKDSSNLNRSSGNPFNKFWIQWKKSINQSHGTHRRSQSLGCNQTIVRKERNKTNDEQERQRKMNEFEKLLNSDRTIKLTLSIDRLSTGRRSILPSRGTRGHSYGYLSTKEMASTFQTLALNDQSENRSQSVFEPIVNEEFDRFDSFKRNSSLGLSLHSVSHGYCPTQSQ